MNKIFTLLVASTLLMASNGKAQTIAEYSLDATVAATSVDPNLTAGNITAVGVNIPTPGTNPGSNGFRADQWPVGANLDSTAYFEVVLTPDPGFEMNITEIRYNNRRSATGPPNFAVYWSLDGVFANSTMIQSGTIASGSSGIPQSITGLDIDVPEGEQIYIRWYAWEASAGSGTYWMSRFNGVGLEIDGTLTTLSTAVSFASPSGVTSEGDGTYDIVVSIENPSATVDTEVDVVLMTGDDSAVNGFNSQTVVFPAGSSADQTVTLTIVDDALCKDDEFIAFQLMNPTGGNSTIISSPSNFSLQIIDNDKIANLFYEDDFESNNLNNWTQGTDGHWATSTVNAISGTYSLKHNLSDVQSTSYISLPTNDLELSGMVTTWRFQLQNGDWEFSGNNRPWVYLVSSEETIFPTNQTTGYAVGIENIGPAPFSRFLALYRIPPTGEVPLVVSTLNWNEGKTVGVEVVRDEAGNWVLRYDEDGGFDDLVTAGSAFDDTYTSANYMGLAFQFTSTRAGELWMDDFSVTQTTCQNTFYSQQSGDFGDDIWDVVPGGTAGPAVFNLYNDFVIQSGHDLDLTANVDLGGLTIESGASLDMGTDGYTLKMTGDWSNNGSFEAGDGNVRMVGVSNVTASGNNTFYDLSLDKLGGTVTMDGATDLLGTLTVTKGNLDTDGNPFTLKSTASQTASVGPVGASSNITGDFTVERYIQNGPTGWRNMGSSVSGATLQGWNEHFTTTGFPGADFPDWPTPANRFVSLKYYDETLPGDREIGWMSPTNTSNVIPDGRGYWMYIGGSELPETVNLTGELITGDFSYDLDYTESLGDFHDGWNLLSNVYASTVDWDSPNLTKVDIENGIWIWDANIQQYGTYISSVSTHGVTNEIAHSQSFWVHTLDINAALTFRESAKSSNNNADWIKQNVEAVSLVRLQIDGNGFMDETVLVFNDDATIGYEGTHDAMKFFSPNEEVPSLAMLANNGEEDFDVAINALPMPETGGISIPLKALAGVNGNYLLSVSDIQNLPSSACLYVEDLETGDVMLIEEGANLTVALDTGYHDARFVIHVSAPVSADKTDNSCADANDGMITALGAGEGPWTYTWLNEAGQVVKVSENLMEADTLNNLAAGLYTLEVSGSDEVCGTRSEEFYINEPMPLSASTILEAANCNSGANGQVAVLASGGQGTWSLAIYQNEELLDEVTNEEGTYSFVNLESGWYTIQAGNTCGVIEEIVHLFDESAPVANFEGPESISLTMGGEVNFTNTSLNAEWFEWFIGDDEYYTENITHTFTLPGTHEVIMYAFFGDCYDVVTKSIEVTDIAANVEVIETPDNISIWYDGREVVIEHSFNGQQMDIRIMNILGQTLYTNQSFAERTMINVGSSEYTAGVYLVNVSINDEVKTQKIVINR